MAASQEALMWSHFSVDELSERTRRFGCFGSATLVLGGVGLVVFGAKTIKASETDWIGWVLIALGVILVFIGGGWTFFEWLWFP